MHRVDTHWRVSLAIGIIVLAAGVAYRNTFSVPLLLDDNVTIIKNPSIRHFGSFGSVLSPPSGVPSVGRPLLNLTFAVNYAMGGLSVGGYHAVNLLIHMLAGITLFGIMRATLSLPGFKEKYGGASLLLALAVATLWTLHPIQTESVTYISQRAESLMGLFYLATLYFFIRAGVSPAPGIWAALSVAACALGMMTKEVMVSAPLIVLLYDRVFIAGSFREAWRRRWRIHLGLAASWLLLAGLMSGSGLNRRGVGYGANFTGWTYGLTESKVVVDYLKLALWPHPLVFDYGPDLKLNRFAEAVPYLLILFLLLALALLASRRRASLGFLGAWFFLILAPTSSVVPVVGQPMAESRMYLPLAAIVTLAVLALYACAGRKGLSLVLALAIVLGTLTIWRNLDYRDEVAIWSDTLLKRPGNSRAHDNLGNALVAVPGRLPDAIAHFETALKIDPDDPVVHNNLGSALSKTAARLPDAIAQYEAALGINPDSEIAHNNLGVALAKTPGRLADAIAHFEMALKINPDYADPHFNLGSVLTKIPGRLPDAIAHFEAALKINPDYAEAHNNLGNIWFKSPGRLPDAITHYEAALKIKPDYAEAHFNLGKALLKLGHRDQEAWAHIEAALRLRPDWEPLVARMRSVQP